MGAWLSSIVVSLATKLGSWLLTKATEWFQGRREKAATENEIDTKLSVLKDAYKEAFDGNPPTPEQREKLKKSISDFVRGNNTPGV